MVKRKQMLNHRMCYVASRCANSGISCVDNVPETKNLRLLAFKSYARLTVTVHTVWENSI